MPEQFTGTVEIRDSRNRSAIKMDGERRRLAVGGDGMAGTIVVKQYAGEDTIRLDGDQAEIHLGHHGKDGDLFVQDEDGNPTVVLRGGTGALGVGGNQTNGTVLIRNSAGKITIRLDGEHGDILLQNADCAEEFDLAAGAAEPGTIMVLGQEGALQESREAYDKKAVGVVAGAGDLKPGIILGRQSSSRRRAPIALMGRVYCKVDARYAPLAAGDLVTSSPTPGHGMKVTDPLKAFGAVIGKTLQPLARGRGLIPILIALQ